MSVHRDHIGTPVADTECGSRLLINTSVGLAAGFAGALGFLIFRKASTDPRRNAGAIYRALCFDLVPITTGGAALYTALSCNLESSRGVKDWRNSAIGGAVVGGLVSGIRYRTPGGALVGALLFAAGASAPDVAASMSPTPEEFERAGPKVTLPPPYPTDYAANSKASQALTRTLQ